MMRFGDMYLKTYQVQEAQGINKIIKNDKKNNFYNSKYYNFYYRV